MRFMSLAEYARHRGVSRAAVTIAIKEGRITGSKLNGKRGVYAEQADLQWEANTQAANIVATTIGEKTYNEIRTEKEKIQSDLLQLKYNELAGELVPAKDVEAEWSKLATLVKTKVLAIASKMKQRYSELTLEQYDYLDQLAREALEEIANGTD